MPGAGRIRILAHAVQHRHCRRSPARLIERLGAKQARLGLRIVHSRQVFERPGALMPVRRDPRQLQIRVGVPRVQLHEPLEIRARLFDVAAEQIVITQII